MSILKFLSNIKTYSSQKVGQKLLIVTGNESADLDSYTASLLCAYFLSRHAPSQRLQESVSTSEKIVPLLNIAREEVSLRPELKYLLSTLGLNSDSVICKDELPSVSTSADFVLVDHNKLLPELEDRFSTARVVAILDHHADEGMYPKADPRIIEPVGSCTTLIVDYFSKSGCLDLFSAAEQREIALLGISPIIVDTANLTSKALEKDKEAVRTLIGLLPACDCEDMFNKLMAAKRDVDSFSLRDLMRKDYKEWADDQYPSLGIESSVKSLAWALNKFTVSGFIEGVQMWAKERNLDVMAYMDSYLDDEHKFHRDLLVYANTDRGKSVVDKFLPKAETEFELVSRESWTNGMQNVWMWEQRNLTASRKQVAPLLRLSAGYPA
ncbi:uncharacterized protein V1516DRAFT_669161 [Lipomyces oligophaga]|uniref:uncharacterized protein n=1 Tax=Lipomyces oligophaga TaxID=45792 RepID=UPI0034CD6D2D